jgi:hypothetical protein
MKNILSIILVGVLLYSCEPITKIQLPHLEDQGKIEYLRQVETTLKKEENYNNIIKELFIICPKANIKMDDKTAGYFLINGNSEYLYRGSIRKFTYAITCNVSDSRCVLKINDIHILGHTIELFYFDNSRSTIRKLNPSYDEINTIINKILNKLSQQVK